MPDILSPAARSKRMSLTKSKDTRPERMVRRIAHGLGYRFRLHRSDLPGRPDLCFPKRHAVIFVHGCFWHQHPSCIKARKPKSRRDYWIPKFAANRKRDAKAMAVLAKLGWRSLIIWECETKNPEKVRQAIRRFLGR